MTESASPDSGPLSVDQAIAALIPQPVEQEAPEAPVEAAAEPEENPEGETSSPEETPEAPEQPSEEEPQAEAAEEPVVALEPPKYWSQEAKAEFAALPPSMQAVVLAQEGPREEITAKVKAEAAEKVKAAEAELSKVNELASALADRLPQWVQAFESRWGSQTPDWVAFAQEHGVEAMTLAKTQFEAERQQLQDAAAETVKAQAIAQQNFVKTEFARLAEIEPDLAPSATDPKQGAEKRQEVTRFLVEKGIPQDAIAQISALEMSLAYDAMRWRQAQAALKAAPKPKPAAPAPKAPVRPAAAAPAPNPTKQAAGRFHQAPTMENAIALLLANKA